MSNQLHLSLLSWAVDYQKIAMYSNEFFVIPDKHFYVHHIPYWGQEIFPLAVIKNSAGYW